MNKKLQKMPRSPNRHLSNFCHLDKLIRNQTSTPKWPTKIPAEVIMISPRLQSVPQTISPTELTPFKIVRSSGLTDLHKKYCKLFRFQLRFIKYYQPKRLQVFAFSHYRLTYGS